MDFEEMKVIWDSQNDQPLYALDEKALHANVRRQGQCIEKSVSLFEGLMIAILLAVAAILVGKRLIVEPEYHLSLWLGGGLTMLVAIVASLHLARWRSRRRQREQKYDPSLRGDIDKAISQVDYQVARYKTFHYWFMVPMALMIALSFVMNRTSFWELFGSKIWVLPLFLGALVICYVAIQFEIRRFHRPRKRRLQALRDKLVAEN